MASGRRRPGFFKFGPCVLGASGDCPASKNIWVVHTEL
ncbi:rCG35659, partial [Rattus norvegicus]